MNENSKFLYDIFFYFVFFACFAPLLHGIERYILNLGSADSVKSKLTNGGTLTSRVWLCNFIFLGIELNLNAQIFIYIFWHLGLETTNIPARCRDENSKILGIKLSLIFQIFYSQFWAFGGGTDKHRRCEWG